MSSRLDKLAEDAVVGADVKPPALNPRRKHMDNRAYKALGILLMFSSALLIGTLIGWGIVMGVRLAS